MIVNNFATCNVRFDDVYNRQKIVNYLTHKFISDLIDAFTIENMPINIPTEYFIANLLYKGNVGFFKVNDDYYINQIELSTNLDYLYRPTICISVNPYQKFLNGEFDLKENVVLIKNDFLGQGEFLNIAQKISMLVDNFLSQKMSVINTRIDKIFFAETQSDKETFDKYIENIEKGNNTTIFQNKNKNIDFFNEKKD